MLNKNHPTYDDYSPIWQLLRDAVEGEHRIKKQTTKYLPKPAGQTTEDYRKFLERSSFFNAGERTIKGLMGSLFRRKPQFHAVVGDNLDVDNITRDGKSLLEFIKTIAKEIIHVGRVGVLVDRSTAPNSPAYITEYKAENIINWRTEIKNGKKVLTQVVLLEAHEIPNEEENMGIGTKTVTYTRILELDPSTGFYLQRLLDENDNLLQVIQPLRYGKPLPFIPFYFFGTYNTDPEIQKSPILDLININISHYRSSASLEHGRFFAGMPTYYLKGNTGDDDPVFRVGPNTVWLLNEDDEAGILEFKGAGLKYLESALEQKEEQMVTLGARLVTQQRKQAAKSRESVEMEFMSEQATLLDIADTIDIGMTRVLKTMLFWEDKVQAIPEEQLIEINKDFTEGKITPRELKVIQEIYSQGLLPKRALYHSFRNAGIVPSTMSFEDFEKNILSSS